MPSDFETIDPTVVDNSLSLGLPSYQLESDLTAIQSINPNATQPPREGDNGLSDPSRRRFMAALGIGMIGVSGLPNKNAKLIAAPMIDDNPVNDLPENNPPVTNLSNPNIQEINEEYKSLENMDDVVPLLFILKRLRSTYGVTSFSDTFSESLLQAFDTNTFQAFLSGWGKEDIRKQQEKIHTIAINNITPESLSGNDERRLVERIRANLILIYEFLPHLALSPTFIEIGKDQGIWCAQEGDIRLEPQEQNWLLISLLHEAQHAFDRRCLELRNLLNLEAVAGYYDEVYRSVDYVLRTWANLPLENIMNVKGANLELPLFDSSSMLLTDIDEKSYYDFIKAFNPGHYADLVGANLTPELVSDVKKDTFPKDYEKSKVDTANLIFYQVLQVVLDGSEEEKTAILKNDVARKMIQNGVHEIYHYFVGPVKDWDNQTLPNKYSQLKSVMPQDIYADPNNSIELKRFAINIKKLPGVVRSNFWEAAGFQEVLAG